jgi:cytochrome o ubiquinol oxidase operon protein cyoD
MASAHTHTHHEHGPKCNHGHDHGHDHGGHHGGHGADHGSLKSYMVGFVLSIILTVIPFWMVMNGVGSQETILTTIVALAVVQILVHLVYFLHMNGKSDQRWNTVAFAFTVLVVLLVVGGSIWIMSHAMSNLMPVPSLQYQ